MIMEFFSWLPIDIKFVSDDVETDIMLINKQKVDVLNKVFK
nr:hypothetical protein [Mycoplasmopsis bovis]